MRKSKEAKSFSPVELAGQIDLAATRFLRAFGLAGGTMEDLQGWVEHPMMLSHALESSKDWARKLVHQEFLRSMGSFASIKVENVDNREVPEEIRPHLLYLKERDFLTRNHTSDMVRVSIVACKDHNHEDPCILIYVRLSERLVGHEGSHHTELRCRFDCRVYREMVISQVGCGEDQLLREMIKWWADKVWYHHCRDYCHH